MLVRSAGILEADNSSLLGWTGRVRISRSLLKGHGSISSGEPTSADQSSSLWVLLGLSHMLPSSLF